MRQRSQQNVIEHLERHVLRSIKDDISDVLGFQATRGPGGIHSIPRDVFCYIDYLGSVRYGLRDENNNPATTEHAVNFIEEYFFKVNPKYKDIGRLIYTMWRHGTVHEYDPKVLINSSQDSLIGWLANKSPNPNNTACHLMCLKYDDSDDEFTIVMNLFQLVEDLLSALKIFIKELKLSDNNNLLQKVQNYFDEIPDYISIDKLKMSKANRKIIDQQMEKAVREQHLIIDRHGNILNGPC